MARRVADEEEWDDDEEGYGDDEGDDEDGEPTVPCPYCGREILEDSPRCPHCERYVSQEDAPRPAKPWWLIVGVAAGLYAVYRWVVG